MREPPQKFRSISGPTRFTMIEGTPYIIE